MYHLMSKKIFIVLAFIGLQAQVKAVSIVYNFRIAQITRHQFLKASNYNRHTGVLIFDHWRQRYDGTRQHFVGGFSSFIYNKNAYYFRVDGAASHIHEKIACTNTIFSGTKTDDVLFSGGKAFELHNAEVSISGLFGAPTHKIFSLQHVDFGTGQFGIGIQGDGIYRLSHKDSLIAGGRYLYFFPGHALDPFCNKHRFSIGQGIDLLIAHSHIWLPAGIEYGYTVRFPWGSIICPQFLNLSHLPLPIQSAFYFVYKYVFHTKNTTQGFLFNISYAFDHSRNPLTNKHIITLFAAWGISF